MRLLNKTALITGGGAGIGAATAHLFCQEGASVVIVDFNQEALLRTSELIRSVIPNARIAQYAADVSDEKAAFDIVEKALNDFGSLDVLVNNAAMRNYSLLSDATPAEWHALRVYRFYKNKFLLSKLLKLFHRQPKIILLRDL